MLSTLSMISLAVQTATLAPAEPQQATSAPPPMKCETGPARRTFGGTQWIVYSCDDHTSMVVVSAEGNPASPFYFFLKPNGGTYTVSGEGNGEKKASDAAGDALAKMTPAEFTTLLAATKGGPR
jgi:hypothetical protein